MRIGGQARTRRRRREKARISGRRGDGGRAGALGLDRLWGRREFPEPFFRLRAARVRVLHAQMLSCCAELLRGVSGLFAFSENLGRGALAIG